MSTYLGQALARLPSSQLRTEVPTASTAASCWKLSARDTSGGTPRWCPADGYGYIAFVHRAAGALIWIVLS